MSPYVRLAPVTGRKAVVNAGQFEENLVAGLQRLQSACGARGNSEGRLESATCEAAWSVARMVCEAGMKGVRLPRNYAADIRCGEPYLARLVAPNGSPPTSSDSPDAQIEYILARRDSIVARMDPRARNLSHAVVAEFTRDLEEGLIDEIADFIEFCNASDDRLGRALATWES